MAYINSEKTKLIREELKKQFPSKHGWKFSVRNENHTSIYIAVLRGPVKFKNEKGEYAHLLERGMINRYIQINEHYLEDYEHSDLLKQIVDIANCEFLSDPKERNFNDSDTMSDYFHVGWFIHITIGAWNKPYQYIENKKVEYHESHNGDGSITHEEIV